MFRILQTLYAQREQERLNGQKHHRPSDEFGRFLRALRAGRSSQPAAKKNRAGESSQSAAFMTGVDRWENEGGAFCQKT